jgi:succinoglycan biosynthesis protein ExoA
MCSEQFVATVIVPCRNEVKAISGFLEDLVAQEGLDHDLEIIIADGMSDDGTREVLALFEGKLPGLRIIDNHKMYVSPGLNRAIVAAHGKFVIRMDVHTTYAQDYCAKCLEVIRKTGAANVGGPARTVAHGKMACAIAAAYASPFAVGGARFHFPEYEGEVDTVTYGCWTKQTLLDIGLFDELLVRNQDDELNLRLKRAGLVIWQSPEIRSWYHPRGNLRRLFQQYFQYGFWKVAVIRKHGTPASWRHLVPSVFVLSGLLGFGLAFVHPWGQMLFGAWLLFYAAFLVVGSVMVAAKKGWRLLPLLPLTFMCFHFGYGLGFVKGLVSGKRLGRSESMTSLSR